MVIGLVLDDVVAAGAGCSTAHKSTVTIILIHRGATGRRSGSLTFDRNVDSGLDVADPCLESSRRTGRVDDGRSTLGGDGFHRTPEIIESVLNRYAVGIGEFLDGPPARIDLHLPRLAQRVGDGGWVNIVGVICDRRRAR